MHRTAFGTFVASCGLLVSAGCVGPTGTSNLASKTPLPSVASPATFTGNCAALAGLPVANGSITSATTVAAGTVLMGNTLPEHCLLLGQIAPRIGVDGKRYAIGFELRLPRDWNGRFLFQGGGGNDGATRPALGALAGNADSLTGLQTGGLAQHYAVVSTDAGHQGLDASFGLDPQARIDHAYNSYDKVTVTAKDLITRAYGKPPDHSYFVGCSGGGRQALLFPQRFATYFDGIAANAPAMKVAKEASVAGVWDVVTFSAASPLDASGKPILSGALSPSDLGLVSKAVLERCDALDGVVDGIIHANPSACDFDPAVLQCSGAKTDSCLSAAQIAALKKNMAGPKNSSGQPLYASWAWDAGLSGRDWRLWRLGDSKTSVGNSRDETLIAADAMLKEFFTPPDPTFNYLAFNFDTDPAKMDAYAAIYDTTSTELGAFKSRGAKMLIVHGISDPIFSVNDSIAYYDKLTTAYGAATKDFARLFLVPGMNHCSNSGGPSTDLYDALAPLVAWVENGTAPDSIGATAGPKSPWPGRTRPLCAYPKQAHYKGSGSIEAASSFSCQ
jgi:Tannase and feruloyl esterase